MSELTVEEIDELIHRFGNEEGEDSYYSESGWYHFKYEVGIGESEEVPGLGTVTTVSEYGGEGDGDQYWVVVKVGDRYIMKPGYYASHDGGYLDGDAYEVTPVEKVVTVYE